MKDYDVDFLEPFSLTHMLPKQGHFKFEPKGRLKKLQTWLWNYLKKCGAVEQGWGPVVITTRHRIKPDTFINKLYRQKRAIYDHLRRSSGRLVIGSKEYYELMSLKDTPQWNYFGFYCDTLCVDSDPMKPLTMKIEVVPWMTGFIVLP